MKARVWRWLAFNRLWTPFDGPKPLRVLAAHALTHWYDDEEIA